MPGLTTLRMLKRGTRLRIRSIGIGRKIRNEKRQQVMSSPPITPFGRFSNQSLIQCYAFHEVSTYTLSTRFSPMLLVYPYASTNSKGPLLCLFWGLLLWCNSSMSQCARAKRNILNHVLIREHQQGFFPKTKGLTVHVIKARSKQEPTSCPSENSILGGPITIETP